MPPYGVVRGRRSYTEPMGLREYNAKGSITSHLGTTLKAPLPAMNGLGEEQGLK